MICSFECWTLNIVCLKEGTGLEGASHILHAFSRFGQAFYLSSEDDISSITEVSLSPRFPISRLLPVYTIW